MSGLEKINWKNWLARLFAGRYAVMLFMFTVVYFTLRSLDAEMPVDDLKVDYLLKHLRRAVDALLFTLPLCFMLKRRYVTVYVLVVIGYLFANSMYYRTYHTLMPMSAFLMVGNLDGIGQSVINSFVGKDVIVALLTVLFLIYYAVVRPRLAPLSRSRRLGGAAVGVVVILLAYGPAYIAHGDSYRKDPLTSYKSNKVEAYLIYGFPNYWIYSAGANSRATDVELQMVNDYFAERDNDADVTVLAPNDGRNLIVVLVESFQSWPIGMEIEGRQVTPHLNEIVGDSGTLFFRHVLPQVKHGRSADAQLLINTGLLPINDGATAFLYGDNVYPSLPKALAAEGYKSYSFTCDSKDYWNQDVTCRSYGFDSVFDCLGLREGSRSWIHADEKLVDNVLALLPGIESPFYAQIVTMSGHDVVDNELDNDISELEIENRFLKNQLMIYRYEDEQLRRLLEGLKALGIYDNSIIVITGDHDATGYDIVENRARRTLSDRFIPFIVINSPLQTDAEGVIGQVDIYPTLLDIMGLDYGWRGLGESAFREHPRLAVSYDGESVGQEYPAAVVEQKARLWDISDIIIRENYFADHN